MSLRSEILGRIRDASEAGSPSPARKKAVQQRLKNRASGVLPYHKLKKQNLIAMFEKKAIDADATVVRCSTKKLSAKISEFLRQHNLPAVCRTGRNPQLKKLMGSKNSSLKILNGPSDGSDIVGLSTAIGGIAETGTLILTSGPENPTTLNFLPENHLVVIHENDIAMHQEDIWQKIRKRFRRSNMPRTINMITGPSRSADIEQTLILGAHGPLRLHILIVSGQI